MYGETENKYKTQVSLWFSARAICILFVPVSTVRRDL